MRRDLNNSQNQQTLENIQPIGTIFRYGQAFELLSQALLSNSIYAIAVLILSFELAYDGNMLCVIYCIYSKLFIQILHQLYFYRTFANINIKYNQAIMKLLSIFFEGCYVLTLNMYVITRTNELLLFSNIFPVINIFLSLIVKINEGNQFFKESVQQINLLYVFRNICILLISIFFSLKIEKYFDIQWLYTLWMLWLLFSLSASIVVLQLQQIIQRIIVSFIEVQTSIQNYISTQFKKECIYLNNFLTLTIYYIFVVLALCIQVILEQSNRQKYLVITNVWILIFMISCSSMFFMIPISVLNYNYGNYKLAILVDRIILIANQIIFTCFTIKFKPELISTLQMYLSLNDSVNPLHTLATQQVDVQLQQFNKQDFIESQVSEAQMQIPKVVKRISKTYFGFDELNSDKKSDSKIQEQNKKPLHQRALSSQIKKNTDQNDEKIKLASMVNLKITEKENLDELKGTSNQKDNQIQNQPRSISLSSINQCCICFDNDPDALFMQCGHGGVCYNMWKNKDECYLCRKKIERVLQIQVCENEKNIYQVVGATELNSKLKKRNKISQQQ